MAILLLIYVLVGPSVWVGMFAAYGLARARMDRLRKARPLPANPPRVCILIPAKDEAGGIEPCIRSTLAQDYPHFRILAIDDRSVDATGDILDRLASRHGELDVLHVEKTALPTGWLGKCHALDRGVQWIERNDRAVEWILFVDSDVTLQPNALTVAITNAVDRHYDAVSILTRLECATFAERLILPIAAAAWSVLFTAAQTNDDELKTNAIANGQFFLVNRTVYGTVGGHAAVRDQITEDVELMRRLKAFGFRVRLCFGDHLAATRMHATFNQMLHGWGRIYSGTSRRRMLPIVAGMLFVIVAGFGVWPVLVYGITERSAVWVTMGIIHWAVMTGYAALVYARTGQPKRNAAWFPISQLVLLILFGYALRMCRTGRVLWRDTHYAAWTPVNRAAGGIIAGRSVPVPGATATGVDRRSDAPTPPG